MDSNGQKALFDAVERQLRAQSAKTDRVAGNGVPQIGDTLRVLLPATEAGEPVLAQLMAISISQEVTLLQCYTTLIPDVSKGRDALAQALPDMNFNCALGAFGLYQEQLYHKYSIPLYDEPVDMLCERVISMVELLCNQFELFYDGAVDMAQGRFTAEEALARMPGARI